MVNYNTKTWADDKGRFSPNKPWFWQDCGRDGICPDSYKYIEPDDDGSEGDKQYQPGLILIIMENVMKVKENV